MKTKRLTLVLVSCGLLAAGCSSLSSRIAKNREAFASWPPAVQDKIIAGKIDVGFTPEQVRMTLGEPDRVFTRTTADGTSEIWSYRDRKPRVSFGVGVGFGSGGRSGGTFGGVGLGTGGGYRDDEKLGVVFDRTGHVSAIEERGR